MQKFVHKTRNSPKQPAKWVPKYMNGKFSKKLTSLKFGFYAEISPKFQIGPVWADFGNATICLKGPAI